MKRRYAFMAATAIMFSAFMFSTQSAYAQPANDDCDGAPMTNVPVDGSIVTVTGNNTGATDGLAAGATQVWEAFTIDSCATVTITLCSNLNLVTNGFISVTDCPVTAGINGETDSLCSNGNFGVVFTELDAGTYYYPVLADSAFGANGDYTLDISAVACPPVESPDNDAACDAIEIIVGAVAIMGDLTAATADGPAGDCWFGEDPTDNDVWYTFVAPEAGAVIIETFETGLNDDTQINVFSSSDGTCTGELTNVGCNDDNPNGETLMSYLELTELTAGDTYWVQVDGYQGLEGDFSISVTEPIVEVECVSPDAIICDNFDNYQLGPDDFLTANHWGLWPAAGVIPSNVVNNRAFSNDKSMKLGVGPVEDPVLEFGTQETGVFTADWMMYIPSDSTAYFNGQAISPNEGGDWTFHVFFAEDGTLELTEQDGATVHATGTFPQDEWFAVSHIIDLNNDVMTLSIAGVEITSDYVHDESLGGINFYANGDLNTYYLDDIVIDGNPDVSVNEYAQDLFDIYPNPTEGLITITGAASIDGIIVRDVLGAMVKNLGTNFDTTVELDLSDLETGVYFFEVQSGDQVSVQRFVKK